MIKRRILLVKSQQLTLKMNKLKILIILNRFLNNLIENIKINMAKDKNISHNVIFYFY